MTEVDARGYSCPVPVVKTKKAMDENPKETLTVLVETVVSKESHLGGVGRKNIDK